MVYALRPPLHSSLACFTVTLSRHSVDFRICLRWRLLLAASPSRCSIVQKVMSDRTFKRSSSISLLIRGLGFLPFLLRLICARNAAKGSSIVPVTGHDVSLACR